MRLFFLFSCFLIGLGTLGAQSDSLHFRYDTSGFYLNGKPFQIWSGEMHFQRIPRLYWRDRLMKAKAMGLNTVATYVFWNALEPQHGKWNFQEQNDLRAFIQEAKGVGLYVILRPGPYACAEWDFGGLPAWLLAKPGIRVRSTDPAYLQPALNYINQIAEIIRPLQVSRGGNILMVQVENEFGSYGKDPAYLLALRDAWRANEIDVPLSTSDGASKDMLTNGSIPGCVVGLDPGVNANDFATAKKYRPDVPAFCAEYYPGWLTHWGEPWARGDSAETLRDLEWLIKNKKSWNLYVLHGGTNFGFYAGANMGKAYQPDITSYDYDAPVREDGTLTPRYFAIRKLLQKYCANPLPELPKNMVKVELHNIEVRPYSHWRNHLQTCIESDTLQTMEQLGQNFGLVLYRHTFQGARQGTLAAPGVHDYATVYLDGRYIGAFDRSQNQFELEIALADSLGQGHTLEILVEGMGRINYGRAMTDPKGMTKPLTLGGQAISGWQQCPVPLDGNYMDQLSPDDHHAGSPGQFFRGSFYLATLGDTYLDVSDWDKGYVWVNGHNLGRYWKRGPQQRLYCPAAFMRRGKNDIIVFDLHKIQAGTLRGVLSLE